MVILGIFAWASISNAWSAPAKVLMASTIQSAGLEVVRESLPIKSDEMAILQESKPLVTRAGAWHEWHDRIHLHQGQEKIRLVLTFTNGAEGRAKFTDLKVQLARKPFATLKDFDGADTLSCNLTNKLTKGNTALVVQGFGPSGARLNWKLYIQRPEINAVKPNPLSPSDTVHIEGNNFSEHAGDTKVLVANKPAKLSKTQNTELELKVADDSPSGNQDLTVVVHSVESKSFKVFVKGSPHITWVNMLASPPSEPVTLSGTGFSAIPSENIVTFGRVRARVVSATASSITCIVPEMHFPQWHVPITVTTNGMPSKGRATINIDARVIFNEGVPML
jgi:hypothetical protein